MVRFALMTLFVAVAQAAADEPSKPLAAPVAKSQLVRPVLWWSDLNRFSDGGSSGPKPRLAVLADAGQLAAEWDALKLTMPVPKVDFQANFALLIFRESGFDFRKSGGLTARAEIEGGLMVDPQGEAKLLGVPASITGTNAGWHSTTIAIFPRQGIVTVEGQKTAAKPAVIPWDRLTIPLGGSMIGLQYPQNLTITRAGKVTFVYIPFGEMYLGRNPIPTETTWEIPAAEAAALIDGIADRLRPLIDKGLTQPEKPGVKR